MLHETLFAIGLLIVTAKLAEGIFHRLRLNSIVAYAVTGVVLGPVTGLIELTHDIQILAGFGVIVLFFLIGLDEIDIPGFVATIRGRLFSSAAISVLISLLAALVVTSDIFLDLQLGLDFTEALALAGILSLSSLGLVAKVLADEGRLRDPVGIQIFTTVIIAELLALLVVGFTIGEHTHSLSVAGVLLLLGQIAGFAVATWLLSVKVLPRAMLLLQRFLHVPQLSFGLLLGGLFLMVAAAEALGLHGSIGALLFGAALSSLPYQVRRDIMPGMRSTAEGLFVPLFFAAAGLHVNLSFLELPIPTIAVLVAIPVLGKFVGAFIGAYVMRLQAPFALSTGLMAKGVAEIALLLVLLETGIIQQDVFSLLVLVMFGYILLMPAAISYAVHRAGQAESGPGPLSGTPPPSLARFVLDRVTVDDLLDRGRTFPGPDLSIRDFAHHWLIPGQQDYVVADKGVLAGIVSLPMLRYRPRDEWPTTALRAVLRHDTPRAWPEEHIEDVLQRMVESSLTALPVLDRDSGQFLGMITNDDILDLIVGEARGEP